MNNDYAVQDHVRCLFKNINFTGRITGIQHGCYIVKIDNLTPELNALRNNSFDPEGCLVLNVAFIMGKVNEN